MPRGQSRLKAGEPRCVRGARPTPGIRINSATPRARGSGGRSVWKPLPRRLGIQAGSGSRPSDDVYAERDLQRVAEVMKRMG